jgi:hypothetical protein
MGKKVVIYICSNDAAQMTVLRIMESQNNVLTRVTIRKLNIL